MPPPPPPPPSTSTSSLHDELDELLSTYLTLLDSYQLAKSRLSRELKSGYFALARSKVALGPTRVGQTHFDLGECSSRIAIEIQEVSPLLNAATKSAIPSTPVFSLALVPSISSLTPTPTISTPISSSSSTTQSLRKRLPPNSKQDVSPTSLSPTTPSPSPLPRSLSRDPILQFSPFPPFALRETQKDFTKVLEASVEVVRVRSELEWVERRVREVRELME